MERFGGAAKIEKPKLIPVAEDLDAYSSLLKEAALHSESRIAELGERAEKVVKPLTRQERIHLSTYEVDADSAFAKGKIQPLTQDVMDGERERIKQMNEHAAELQAMNEDIENGRVPGYEGIRAAKEALHLDQMALHDAEDRLSVLQRKHDAGEQLLPMHYRVMRELSEEVALRRERIKRMIGRISMFGEVLHAQELEMGGGASGFRRARVDRQSSRLIQKDRNGYASDEEEFDHLNPPELPPLTGDEEIAA
ncbi:hypothetical protein M0Q28_05055 [Patescibacteria group bacterium]|jgi:hypothetical protein|nr:hypothetical protein [Patescibacteria group bacterium]